MPFILPMFPVAVSSLTGSKPRREGDAASHLRSNELTSASFCDVTATELLLQQKDRRTKTARQIRNGVRFRIRNGVRFRMTCIRGSLLIIFNVSADSVFLYLQAIIAVAISLCYVVRGFGQYHFPADKLSCFYNNMAVESITIRP